MLYFTRRVHTFTKPKPLEQRYEPRGELFYVKACNGAGKSTIPSYMASTDPDAYVAVQGGRVLLTVFPSYGFLAFGKYDKSKSKGVDALADYDEMKLAFDLSQRPPFLEYDAIFEGVIPATILHTWVEYFNEHSKRKLFTAFIDTPLEECLNRVRSRNGGAAFDEELVTTKYKRVESHRVRHKELFPTTPGVMIRSQGQTIPEMVSLFLNRDFGSVY